MRTVGGKLLKLSEENCEIVVSPAYVLASFPCSQFTAIVVWEQGS